MSVLRLYHSRASVASAKARLGLAEKGLSWNGEVLDLHRGDQHQPGYRAINPNGLVPALVHGDRIIIESSVILAYLDEVFVDPPLMPEDPYDRATARLWMARVDALHTSCAELTFALAFGRFLAKKPHEELAAQFRQLRDPDFGQRLHLAVTQGMTAPNVQFALRHYDRWLASIEEALGRGPYLSGTRYSLADIAATPYVFRAEMLGLDGLWLGIRPNVAAWFARMRVRPSFALAITDPLTDADRERLEVPREEAWPRARDILASL